MNEITCSLVLGEEAQRPTIQMYTIGTPSSGYTVSQVGRYGNPPGYTPND